MGITYEQLVNLNLSKLDEAIEDWRAAKRRAAELKADAREGLGKNFRAAGWESSDGTSASAAKQVKEIEEEFEDAHQVCNAVLGVLGEAKQELAAKKRKLTDLIAAEEAGGDVTVSPTGKVRFNSLAPSADLVRKDDAGQERVDAVVEKIEKVLDEAAEVDDSASAAIRYNIGNEREEFHDHTAARTDDAEARYDSAAAVKLASKGPEMSESELREYNSLLKEHRSDKSFARQFAIRMGPDGVQKFWGSMNPYGYSTKTNPEQRKLLHQTRKEMGATLGLATHDDSPRMKEWKEQLVKSAPEGVDGKSRPLGFQVTSDLMRHGKWDKGFMGDYGESLVKHDKERDGRWGTGGGSNSGGGIAGGVPSHWGTDPVAGFMEGLGHSPGASTEFFSDKGNFEYFLGDEASGKEPRGWPKDAVAGQSKGSTGAGALGHALESATTGRAHGADPSSADVEHTKEQAALAEDVISRFGGKGGEGLLNDPDGAPLADARSSLGGIAADYMPEVQKSVSGSESLILPENRADLERAETSAFLSHVGRDPEAYAAITASQQAYTTVLIDDAVNGDTQSESSTEQRAGNAAQPGAVVAGIMSNARTEAVFETQEAKDEEFNGKAELANKWVGRGIGLGTGRIPVGGEVVGWAVEDIQEGVMGSIKKDTAEDARYESGKQYSAGAVALEESVKKSVEIAGRRGGLNDDTIEDQQTAAAREAQHGFTTGSKAGDAASGK